MERLYCQCMTLIILLLLLNIGLVIGVFIKWQIAKIKCDGKPYTRGMLSDIQARRGADIDAPGVRPKSQFVVRISVTESDSPDSKLYCGGVIVKRLWVITTAHCIEMLQNFEFDRINVENSHFGELNHEVVFMTYHSNFNNITYDADIGLLKVKERFHKRLKNQISIKSPSYKYKVNATVTAIGWTNFYIEHYREDYYLQDFKVMLINYQHCNNIYGGQLTKSMFCAGSYKDEKSACHFEPGSPLLDSKVLVGITSWGTGCGKIEEPIVYTNISLFEKWIRETIRNN